MARKERLAYVKLVGIPCATEFGTESPTASFSVKTACMLTFIPQICYFALPRISYAVDSLCSATLIADEITLGKFLLEVVWTFLMRKLCDRQNNLKPYKMRMNYNFNA